MNLIDDEEGSLAEEEEDEVESDIGSDSKASLQKEKDDHSEIRE